MGERPASMIKRRSVLDAHSKSNDLSAAYDYVMVFPMEGDSSSVKKQSEVSKSVMKIMEDAGLEIFPYLSVQDDEMLVLIRCPMDKLRKFADDINYNLELDPETVKEKLEGGLIGNDPERGQVYKIKPVFIANDPAYSPLAPWDHIYGKYDEDFDQKLYFSPANEGTPFTKAIRLKLIYYLLKAPHRNGGCDLELSKLILKKKILCLFPLHDRAITTELVSKVSAWNCYPWTMPFYDYKEYFGEKITLYNVFIGHYSFWLIWPCIIGLVFQLVVWGTGNFSSPVLPFYSLIITVWSIFMLEYWKRLEATTAMQWGMSNFEQHEPDRPEFRGDLIKSYINGDDMLYYPPKAFANKLMKSQGVILSFIMMVLGVVASIYVLRFSLQNSIGTYASTVASVLNTVQITVFNMIYQVVAVALTNAENHRTDTQYEDSMIVKLFVFQFINSYASFFFLAFIAQNLTPSNGTPSNYVGQCGATNCMQPLSINLAIIFGTRLTLTNFLDIFIPYVNYKLKIKKETQGVAADKYLTPPEQDFMLMAYDPLIEGIKNYADTAIQYGFSLLFITALPCASFFSLLSNYVKVKCNTWKLATFYQRPIPSGAQDIGTWQTIFNFVSIAAVVTNAGLVCFTMDVLNQYSEYGRLWIFVGFQWVLISIQFIAQAIVPDVPQEVDIQAARMNFINEKIIDKVEDEDVDLVASVSVDRTGAEKPAPIDSGTCCDCFTKPQGGNKLEKKLKFTNVHDYEIRQYPKSGSNMTGNPMSA